MANKKRTGRTPEEKARFDETTRRLEQRIEQLKAAAIARERRLEISYYGRVRDS